MRKSGDAALLQFFILAEKLKSVRRQGWVDRGVEHPESVADHSWSVGLLAWTLAASRPELDRERVLLLGIVHDLPEALAGDSTPFDLHRGADGVIPEHHFHAAPEYTTDRDTLKREREEAALIEMTRELSPDLAGELRSAWREYDDAATPEAQFVKQVDKLETVIQAEVYLGRQPGITIDSFRAGAMRDITDPQLRAILHELLAEG